MGFATIEEALEELRAGHLIMCIDSCASTTPTVRTRVI